MAHPEIELARKNATRESAEHFEKLQAYLRDFVEDYDVENALSRRELVADAIEKLVTDEEFLKRVRLWQDQARFLRSLSIYK